VLTLSLLEGVVLGLALAGVLMLRRAVRARVRFEGPDGDRRCRVVVEGMLSFLSVPALSRALGAVPAGAPVRVELAVDYVDHAASDHLGAWTARHRGTGASVEVSGRGVAGARAEPAGSPRPQESLE
jgi:carbonic anhydrase